MVGKYEDGSQDGNLTMMMMTVKMAMWQLTPRRHKGGHLASVRSSAEEKHLQELVLARYSFFLFCRVYLNVDHSCKPAVENNINVSSLSH